MQSLNREINEITEGVIWKQLMAFFFPVLLGSLFQQLYNTVDAMIVGRFVGTEALAAVGGSSSQILNLIIGFFTGVSSGATVIIAQFIGAREEEDVSRSVHTAMVLAAACGAVMTVLGIISAPWLLGVMDTPAETMTDSVLYLRVVYLSMIPGMIYNMGSAILRAAGDAKHPLVFLVICCLVNVALDLLFVCALHMGVAGVAVATSLAQLISAVMVCVFLSKSRESYRLELRQLRADRRMLRRTVRIGLPTGLQSVLYAVSNMIITASINSFGTDTVAAWVALIKLDALTWLVMGAFGVAVMTFVGQNYGARRYDRVKSSIRLCTGIATAVTVTTGTVFLLGGRYFFYLFTDDALVIDMAVSLLLCIAPWYWLYVPVEVLSGSLRGMGDTLIPTIITAVGICLMRVLWVFALVPRWHTIEAVTISYPVTWGLTSLAFTIYYFRFRKKRLGAASLVKNGAP